MLRIYLFFVYDDSKSKHFDINKSILTNNQPYIITTKIKKNRLFSFEENSLYKFSLNIVNENISIIRFYL
jgi:hypothetical protein